MKHKHFDTDLQGLFIVMARVSGGVTGTRQSPCKLNGEIMRFESRELAQFYADQQQNRRRNGNSICNFQYWVEQA